MLLGIWKNIEDLETHINLNELEVILDAARDKEHRHNRFMAMLKGIDIDAPAKEEAKERFDRAKMRAESRLTGRSSEELELDSLGIEIETE